MRDSLITDLLYHLDRDDSLRIGECGEVQAEYLKGISVPVGIVSILRWTWPTTEGVIGRYTIYPIKLVVELCEDYPVLARNSMLPIGAARNGDFLLLRYAPDGTSEVGLLSHDDFWGECAATPDRAYVRVTRTLDEYLWRSAEGKYLPIDYYAARELEALRVELGDDTA